MNSRFEHVSADGGGRYHRQMLLPQIGAEGQRRLGESHVLIVGCGALGSVIVDLLARAGVGTMTIVDRDIVELTNLSRQVLFDEDDVAGGLPKAEAARRKIAAINSDVIVQARVDDFSSRNAEGYAEGVDLILDGLDNFQTRYLLNDLAVKRGLPYVYGGAVGMTGMTMPILPRGGNHKDDEATPCLRCVFPEAPPPGVTPTCDTAGVLASAVTIIASHQFTSAIKILTGNFAALNRSLVSIDVWADTSQAFDVSGAVNVDCPCCGRREFEYLDGAAGSGAVSLCGRTAVQISPRTGKSGAAGQLDLELLAARLAPHGSFESNEFLMRGTLREVNAERGEPIELTVFPDGRAIIKGTTEPETARSIYDKFVGS